jgi:hypothetical protein
MTIINTTSSNQLTTATVSSLLDKTITITIPAGKTAIWNSKTGLITYDTSSIL